MKLSYELTAAQTHRLRLTPFLKQGIDILCMPATDLAFYLQEAVLDNPLLELTPSDEIPGYGRRLSLKSDSAERGGLPDIPQQAPTLHQYVVRQLAFVTASESERQIARFLAGNLDESGYLRIDVEEAASLLGRHPRDVQSALAVLQSLEPAGIGARSLAECLMLQIDRDPQAPPHAKIIVERHLTDLAKRQWKRMAEASQLTIPALKQIFDYVRTLHPRPGLAYAAPSSVCVAPDAYIIKTGDRFAVRLNDHALPMLSLNPEYENGYLFRDDPQALAYYRSKRQEARELLRNIRKRQMTLLRIIGILCQKQQAFLNHGPAALKPLDLKTVSHAAGLHLSTVSRAVRNKFVQTPWGLFELSDFFARPVATENHEAASDRQVKLRIQAIIEGENKAKPYSDQQIAELLQAEGFVISRRTVAKYRNEMNILSTSYRWAHISG